MGVSKTERELQFAPQRYLRRGVFSSVDLSSSIYSSLPESVCVVQFPEAASKEVNAVLSRGEKLMFGLQPTPFEDFRIFDVHLMGMDYVGILVDLPCNIEVYKSLDCESMFKSNNLNQMLYIYDAANLPRWFLGHFRTGSTGNISASSVYKGPMKSTMMYSDQTFVSFLEYLRETLHWEWPGGLLPATREIRSRKYRNTELFDIGEVIEAEQELLDRVSMPSQDMVTIEVVSSKEMEDQIHLFKHEQKNSPFPIPSVFDKKKKATCMGIIGKNDDLRSMISRFKREDHSQKKGKHASFEFDDIQSDISDMIFRESSEDEDVDGGGNSRDNPQTTTDNLGVGGNNNRINGEEFAANISNGKSSNQFPINEEWESHDFEDNDSSSDN
ncbi:TAF7-like RNA polymerase II TAF7L [Cryptosporidium felis]|nr:TAF7-like RNA polymerase II TAF7L [Cryptosporidium felis]